MKKRLLLAAILGALALVPGAWAAAPQNTSAPTIEGQLVVGKTVSAGNGIWSNNPTRFGYQWLRCNENATQCTRTSTDRSLKLTSADEGHALVVLVTASNADGAGGPVNSKP